MNSSQNYTFKFSEEDIKQNKWISLISYLPLLFLIPLILKKNSKYARFHTNQGLSLFITELITVLLYVILSSIANIFSFTSFLIGLNFVMTVVFIIELSILLSGIINASSGLAKSLPFIGGIEILK